MTGLTVQIKGAPFQRFLRGRPFFLSTASISSRVSMLLRRVYVEFARRGCIKTKLAARAPFFRAQVSERSDASLQSGSTAVYEAIMLIERS